MVEELIKKQIQYFRGNIIEAKMAYQSWKMIYHARAIPIVGQELADRYVKIQKYYPNFFITAERVYLMAYVMLLCHAFDDKRNDSYSLDKLGKAEYDEFMASVDNKSVVSQLKFARHKLFAHRDNKINPEDIKLPSLEILDNFFNAVEALYNKITARIEDSNTMFNNANDIKYEIERLYLDIERARAVPLIEVEIKQILDKNSGRISSKV